MKEITLTQIQKFLSSIKDEAKKQEIEISSLNFKISEHEGYGQNGQLNLIVLEIKGKIFQK